VNHQLQVKIKILKIKIKTFRIKGQDQNLQDQSQDQNLQDQSQDQNLGLCCGPRSTDSGLDFDFQDLDFQSLKPSGQRKHLVRQPP
jgi:hypothetical protein